MATYQLFTRPLPSRLKQTAQRLIKKLLNTTDQNQSKFAIDSRLLGDPHTLAWSNLGFWQMPHYQDNSYPDNSRQHKHQIQQSENDAAIDYIKACENLAHVVGKAAQLGSTDQLLDLGCGQGASLQYWNTAFSVKNITAFELQTNCIEKIKQASLPQLKAIYQASFSQLPLPAAHLYHAFDVVVCVDAAYHAPLADFLAVNQAALKPDGRMAFTSLIRPVNPKKYRFVMHQFKKYFNKKVLQLASISPQHLCTEQDVIKILNSFGFIDIQIKHLNRPVLAGFAQYIQRQPSALNRHNMNKHTLAAWLKITLTAKLCGFLYQHQLVNYSVVSATYRPDITSIP